MKKYKLSSMALASILALATAASADTAVFDFTTTSVIPGTPPPTYFNTGMAFSTISNLGNPFGAIAFGQGILAVNSPNILSFDAFVTQTASGLGVLTPGYDTQDVNDPNFLSDIQIDGNNRTGAPGTGADMLILAFPSNVAVNTVIFTLGGGDGDAAASIRINAILPGNGVNIENFAPIAVTALGNNTVSADFTSLPNRNGLAFGFTIGSPTASYDVAGISVDFDPVPLPPAFWSGAALLAGMGTTGIVRRRLATVRA